MYHFLDNVPKLVVWCIIQKRCVKEYDFLLMFFSLYSYNQYKVCAWCWDTPSFMVLYMYYIHAQYRKIVLWCTVVNTGMYSYTVCLTERGQTDKLG